MQHGVLDKRQCLNHWRNFHGLCELVGNVIDTDSWLGGRGRKHSHLYVMMPKIPTQEKDRPREGTKWMKWRCWQLGNLRGRVQEFSRVFFQLFPVGQKLLHSKKLMLMNRTGTSDTQRQNMKMKPTQWNHHRSLPGSGGKAVTMGNLCSQTI